MSEMLDNLRGGLSELGRRARVVRGREGANQAAQLYETQRKMYEQQMAQEEKVARRTAMAQDAMQVNGLLKSGNVDAATMLINDRLDQLNKLGADASDTQRLADMLYNGDVDGAIQATDVVVQAGAAAGLLKIPGQDKDWKPMAPKFENGQMITETAPGQFTAKPVGGLAEAPVEPDFDPAEQRKYLQDARKNITALKTDFRKTQSAYNKLESAAKAGSTVGDLSLVIQLMKLLDPGSVVREGEQQQVQQTAGIPDRLWNMYTKAKGEGSLTPDQRNEILAMGGDFFQGQQQATDLAVFEQLQYANADGFSIERVLGENGAERWNRKSYSKTRQDGSVVEFSLKDIMETAQKYGKRPADVINDLEIDLRKP